MMEKSCGAIIFRTEKDKADASKIFFLMLKYGKGYWDFVKGHVEKGESEVETFRREAEEETGLKHLHILSGFRQKMTYFFRREGKTIHKDVIFFLAESKESKIKISHEHTDFAWLEFDKAVQTATFKNAKDLLKKAMRELKKRKIN